MDGEFKEKISAVTHYYCQHHKTIDSIKIIPGHTNTISKKVRELTPLVLVLLAVSALAFIRQSDGANVMLYMMDWMGLFLVTFGMFKLIDLKGFVEGFSSYDIIAKKFTQYGYIFPFLEIGLGILYLAGFMFLLQNTVVLIISILGMYSAYKVISNKLQIRCVCLGNLFRIPMTWATFIENFLMAVMVLLMLQI